MLSDYMDAAVLVRTVTHYYTGRLVEVDADWLRLSDAAWIPDTGRWAHALASGLLAEVEPYPDECLVSRGAVVDLCHWAHALPRTQI